MGFVLTCLVASANYTINEWLDAEFDRHHPLKRTRPAARGRWSASHVLIEYVVLAAAGLCTGVHGLSGFLPDQQCSSDDGHFLIRSPVPDEGSGLCGRAFGIDQQSAPPASRLVYRRRGEFSAVVRADGILDGRRIPDGDQALCRIPLYRRPSARQPVSAILCGIHRENPAALRFFLCDHGKLLPCDLPHQISDRIRSVVPALCSSLRLVSVHRHEG